MSAAAACALCRGSGGVQREAGSEDFGDVWDECRCIFFRRVQQHLAPLRSKECPATSPLYVAANDNFFAPPVVDRTVDNLIVRGGWDAVRPHLLVACFGRYTRDPMHTYRVATV